MEVGKYVSGTGRIVNENCIGRVEAVYEEEGKVSVRILVNEDVMESLGKKYKVDILSLTEVEAPSNTILYYMEKQQNVDGLLSRFHEMCGILSEMNIYERDWNDDMIAAQEWVEENF